MRIDRRNCLAIKFWAPSLVALAMLCQPQLSIAQGEPAYMSQVRDHVNKGNMMLGRRLFKEAIAEYEKALALDPANVVARNNIAETHNNWGIFYYSQRKWGDAQREWETTLELQPNHFNAKRNLTMLKRMAAAHNIDLNPPDAGSSPAAGSSVITGSTLFGRGDGGGGAGGGTAGPDAHGSNQVSAKPGAQDAKEDTSQPSAVMILTPGVKVGGSPSSATEPFPNAAATSPPSTASAASSGATIISPLKPTAATAAPAGTAAKPVASRPTGSTGSEAETGTADEVDDFAPVTQAAAKEPDKPAGGKSKKQKKQRSSEKKDASADSDSDSQPTKAPKSNIPEKLYPSSASSKWAPAVTKNADAQEETIEDELKLLENKLYGQVQDLPVLKRLEKLEKDTTGKVASGPVRERIQSLRQHYGI